LLSRRPAFGIGVGDGNDLDVRDRTLHDINAMTVVAPAGVADDGDTIGLRHGESS